MHYEYAVVGGGPVGAYAAKILATNHDVALYEEHRPRRQPVHCAGIISMSGLKRLGIAPRDSLLHTVRGAKLYSPGGVEAVIESTSPKAYVVDRQRFDEELLAAAADTGAVVLTERAATITDTAVTGSNTTTRADTIVLATGVDYGLQRRLQLPRPRSHLVGAQYSLAVDADPDFVELHFVVDDFFAWIIPTGDGRCRVGIATKGNPASHLDRFISRLTRQGRVASSRKSDPVYGVIPRHDPALATHHGIFRLVGDAAGHVKATTGGGIVMGCLAARHLDQHRYDAAWRADIGRELATHLRIHRFLSGLSPAGKDALLTWLKGHADLIESHGDMDYASPLLSSLFRRPSLLISLLPHIPRVAWDLLT